MAITRTQIAKQLLAQGGRTGFFKGAQADASAGRGSMSPGTSGTGGMRGGNRGGRDRDFQQRGMSQADYAKSKQTQNFGGRADDIERQKIAEKIQRPPTTFQQIKRSPFFQAASFITNPLSFGVQKFIDSQRAKKINELFGVDDDLGYTGADAGFVNALPEPPEMPREGGEGENIIPLIATPYQQDIVEEAVEELSPIQLAIQQRDELGGARAFAKEGGIMDLETGRQMYLFGKLVKKAKKIVGKITKSPIGKAALLAAPFAFPSARGAISSFFGKGSFNPFMAKGKFSGLGSILNKAGLVSGTGGLTGLGKLAGGAALTAAPLLFQKDDTEDEYAEFLRRTGKGPSIDIQGIRNDPYSVLARGFYAEGGKPEPVAKKTMPLLDMGGQEMDLRAEGGFVPIGRMEKADDVPARLSKNEFVFTADAVRNAGDGNVDKGAEVMYNMMKNLEAGGDVSEESQGLKGARKMFQTSQRLEEVL